MVEEEFLCFSKKLAIYLRKRGFRIIGTSIDFKQPQYDVWHFKDSLELRRALGEYRKTNVRV